MINSFRKREHISIENYCGESFHKLKFLISIVPSASFGASISTILV
jgi:heme/copper-type cytochrome/quinol oxidase subunit 2